LADNGQLIASFVRGNGHQIPPLSAVKMAHSQYAAAFNGPVAGLGVGNSRCGNMRTVRVFRQKFTLEDAIEFHAFAPLQASSSTEHACDQWHSSRVSTFLTSSRCKLHPNTEGGGHDMGSTPMCKGTTDDGRLAVDLAEIESQESVILLTSARLWCVFETLFDVRTHCDRSTSAPA
jgi:hypothetical protein